MDTMTPEQQAAHAALNGPLYLEWMEFCSKYDPALRNTTKNINACNSWTEAMCRVYGEYTHDWVDGAYRMSDCLVEGDLYVWIETK